MVPLGCGSIKWMLAPAVSRVCGPLLGQAGRDSWIPEVGPARRGCKPAASLQSVWKYFNILATDAAVPARELSMESQGKIQEVIRKEKIWVTHEVSKREGLEMRLCLGHQVNSFVYSSIFIQRVMFKTPERLEMSSGQ